MNQATTNARLIIRGKASLDETVTDGFPVGEDVFAGARTSPEHNTTNAPMFQVGSVRYGVGFHSDFDAWKGGERTRRMLPCVISQGFPFNPTYGLIPPKDLQQESVYFVPCILA